MARHRLPVNRLLFCYNVYFLISFEVQFFELQHSFSFYSSLSLLVNLDFSVVSPQYLSNNLLNLVWLFQERLKYLASKLQIVLFLFPCLEHLRESHLSESDLKSLI